jgi:charged multivesicular body protein 5
MNRLFGAKATAPKPTLTSAISNVRSPHFQDSIWPTQVDSRIETVDVKIAKLNAELTGYQQRLAKLREGPGKQAVKQKALKVLQQRKLYEAQRDQLQQQSWNMEQAGMMQDNLKNTMITVDAMKTTTKELRKQYGQVDVGKIERLQDEMADLMDVGNEIQESLGRSYEVPEGVDDDELDAELEALGEEMSLEAAVDAEGMPSYLLDEGSLPQFVDEPPEQGKVKEAAGWGHVGMRLTTSGTWREWASLSAARHEVGYGPSRRPDRQPKAWLADALD